MHGVAIRRAALATSDITEMMHFVASDTRLVMWCFTAYYALGCSSNKGLGRAVGCYAEIILKLLPPR